MEEIRKSYKWRKKDQNRLFYLTLAMLVQYLPVSFLRDVFAAERRSESYLSFIFK